MHMHVLERIGPGARVAGPESIEVPPGYLIEPLVTHLNYPTAISWDADGHLLIAESRSPYGRCADTAIRILRLAPDGALRPLVRLCQPINDLTVRQGLPRRARPHIRGQDGSCAH